MTLINVKCIDQKLYLANMPTVASGGINETKIKFDFCPLWDDFGKVAIFYCNEDAVYNVVIDSNNECVVPYEVLESSGRFYFGVFAINEEGIRRTSDILAYKVVKVAFIEGQEPVAPTPDIYEQILALYAKSMQYNETFYNNVLAANEELFNSFQEENEALYNDFIAANEKLVSDVVEANIDYKEEIEQTQAQIKAYRDELNYYAPFIKVESSTPSAYNLEFDKTYVIKIDWDDEVTNYNLYFNLTYDTNAVDDNKYATRSITVPLEKDQLGKQIKFRVFSWFNEYGQMLFFHYEQTLSGRKGIEYSDTTYGIKGNVAISSLRFVRLDGTAFDLYIENEYGDNGAEGIVKANVELNGTEENLTSLTVNNINYKIPNSIEHVIVSSINISDMMHEMLSKYAVESKDSAYFVGNEYNKGQYYVYLDYAHSRVYFMFHVFNITGNTVYKSKVVDITNLPETIEYTIVDGKVEANPILDGTEQALTSLSINGNKYKVPDTSNIDLSNYYQKEEIDNSLTLKADLVNGLIPAAQLPSYVDDVIEYDKEVSGKSWLETTLATANGSMVWNSAAASNLSGGSSSPYYKKFLLNVDGTEEGLKIVAAETGKIYVNIGSDGYKTYEALHHIRNENFRRKQELNQMSYLLSKLIELAQQVDEEAYEVFLEYR